MRWTSAVAVAGSLMLVSQAGQAADVRGALGGSAEWDSNAGRNEGQTTGDFVFRVTPRVELTEDEGNLRYSVGYTFPYEKAIYTSRLDGFRHFVNANARYYLGERTQIFFNDTFSYSESLNTVQSLAADDVPTISSFEEPVLRNTATLGTEYVFTPRLAGNVALSNRIYHSDIPGRADNMVLAGNTGLNYSLSSRHQLGAGLAGSWQSFEAVSLGGRPASRTLFVNFFASWTWFISETTSFSFTGGPTFVDTRQDAPPTVITGQDPVAFLDAGQLSGVPAGSIAVGDFTRCEIVQGVAAAPFGAICPTDGSSGILRSDSTDPNVLQDIADVTGAAGAVDYSFASAPIGLSSTTWTYFADISLVKRWTPVLSSSISYRRSDSTASGLAGSATLDVIALATNWQLSELWNTNLRLDVTRRESVSPTTETFVQQFDGTGLLLSNPSYPLAYASGAGNLVQRVVNTSIDTLRWGASFFLSRRITENLRGDVRYSYNQQTSLAGTRGRPSDFDAHIVTVGFQYDFDRRRLW